MISDSECNTPILGNKNLILASGERAGGASGERGAW